ncbi:hypothetical protein [[Erwinia] mediterraneensis]|uniref:hypothetical protein n=1 Tax=[Erwinia] mediterraneensis TaxID=2161819 RepID=UPI00103028DC|nr:hypothetical protein [[Erwinia] mediterraneensis]
MLTQSLTAVDGLRWWSGDFIEVVHPDWHTLPFFTLEAESRRALLRADPPALLPLLEVTLIAPEELPDWLAAWLALPEARRQLALWLALAVITPAQAPVLPTASLKLWCQRLHKALRPSQWAGGEYPVPEALLRRSLTPGCWQRIRLLLPAAAVEQAEMHALPLLPTEKCNLLWQAVIWQACREESQNVDTETPDAG